MVRPKGKGQLLRLGSVTDTYADPSIRKAPCSSRGNCPDDQIITEMQRYICFIISGRDRVQNDISKALAVQREL
jgi:hypothetical protein